MRGGGQGAGDEDALELSAGELADGAIGQIGGADQVEHMVGIAEIAGRVGTEQAGLSDQPQADELADAEGNDSTAWGFWGDSRSRRRVGSPGAGESRDAEDARVRLEAQQELHQVSCPRIGR